MLHIDSMRRLPAMLTLALALAFSMNALSPAPAAAQGGPVLIMGIDPENGPPGTHGPVAAYRAMINVMLSQKTNAGNGLCVIGAGKAYDYVTQFWLAVAGQVPAIPIALVNGPQIATVNFSNFAIIVVAGDFENIPPGWGGVTATEWNYLMTRKSDIRRHINCGGGLVGVCAPTPATNPNWYNYLTFAGGATISYQTTTGGFANVALLPTAAAVGQAVPFGQLLASSTDIWHNWYTAFPPALTPIAQFLSNSRPTALGTTSLYVNAAPTANAGLDRTIECTSHAGMSVTLNGSGTDADSDPISYQWWHNGNQIGNTASINVTGLGVGTHTFTLKVNDNQCGPATSDDVVITVQDTQPPTISGVGANASVECPADPYAAFSSPTASDACDANPTLTSADVASPLCGATYSVTRTWTATDDENNSSSASQTITVTDTQAPVFTMNADATLWPPNHEYATFDIDDMVTSVSDACNLGVDASDVTIHSVWSDEPEDATGGGDGNMLDDIVLACDLKSAMLRQERQGGGNGRVYSIKLQVSDGCNTSYAVFRVSVPHEENGVALDDGATAGYTVSTCTLPKDIARDGVIPAGMVLEQNYPNPFNPTTAISFTLPMMSDISLKVFDVNGREVATVARGSFVSGSHTVAFDATNLPSGIYLYRLESSGAVLSRFMQLLK
jgi:hypothetical protein